MKQEKKRSFRITPVMLQIDPAMFLYRKPGEANNKVLNSAVPAPHKLFYH